MTAFWERLSERERLFVAAGGAILALLLFYQLIISPALGWRATMSEKRARAEDLYRLVSQASVNAGVIAAAAGVDLDTPILNVLTQTTAQFGVQVNYRNAREDGGVEANVAADPAKLFEWLKALEEQFGVSVAAADIARSASGEAVQAQLTLVRRTAP
ncbi:MAG: type II secretion system protein GspM [Pseudomonadota bacterium]